VINVVCFQEMLQRSGPLLRLVLDLMCFDFGQLDAAGAARPATEIGQRWPSDLQHDVFSRMSTYGTLCDVLGDGSAQVKNANAQRWPDRFEVPLSQDVRGPTRRNQWAARVGVQVSFYRPYHTVQYIESSSSSIY
jgi:hypothetical protein